MLGFLQSSADFRDDHAVAREYLTPSARQRWRPQTGTVVYDGESRRRRPAAGTVRSTGSEVGRIDARGQLPADADRDRASAAAFGMEQVARRVADRHPGRRAGAVRGATSRRPSARCRLYFLAPQRDGAGARPRPAARAARPDDQAGGPAAARTDDAACAAPSTRRSRRGPTWRSARCRCATGVATVRLEPGRARRRTTQAARARCRRRSSGPSSSWPEVGRCASRPAARTCVDSGVPEEQARDTWRTYDPDGMPGSPSAYVVARRRGWAASWTARSTPVPGPAGTAGRRRCARPPCRWTPAGSPAVTPTAARCTSAA